MTGDTGSLQEGLAHEVLQDSIENVTQRDVPADLQG
jgi:hypothetical protein